MKKLKVENISNIKLDFFLKQNDQELRVVLNADESTWCDLNTNTKSMILYERKNLIRVSEIEDLEIKSTQVAQETLPVMSMSPIDPVVFINMVSDIPVVISEESKQETKEEKKNKASGKKRGRKKKRGPKPGMAKKKKKLAEKLEKEKEKGNDGNSENIQDQP